MRTQLALIALLLLVLAGGCHKTNSPKPNVETQPLVSGGSTAQPQVSIDTTGKPQTGGSIPGQPQTGGSTPVQPQVGGSIKGNINSAYGTDIVLIANTVFKGTKMEYRASVKTDGNFTFLGLPEGAYLISSVSGARYLVPDNKVVQVLWGGQTDLGMLALVPNPDNGKIIGSTKPAGAAGTVFVQCIEPLNGMRFEAVPDPVTGNFELPNLPPGKWSVSFAPAKGFKAPAGLAVIISTKQIADVGTFNFEVAPPVSVLSFKSMGMSFSMEGTATYDQTNIVLSGLRTTGTYNSINYKTYRLVINLSKITAPGTYVCNEGTTSKITYIKDGYRSINSNGYGTWGSHNTGGSAIVAITKIDPTTKTIQGTFSANLAPANASSKGNQEITEGSFTAIYK